MKVNKLPKCLIVDDLEDNITALKSLLVDEKVEIHSATSGMEALELLLKNDYALSLIDVQMPVMDGFELAEIMRSTEKTKSIPIIFVTAGNDGDVKRVFKGYEAGAVDFLYKPLYPQIVLGKVRVFLDLYNQKILIEDTFQQAKEELEQKVQERTQALIAVNKELEAFSYSVSHDLRAPLRSMDGFSKILISNFSDKLDDKGKDYLNRIRESAQKMGDLIDGMLILSRLGKKEIRREKINLSHFSEKIIKDLRQNDFKRQVKVFIDPDLEVEADPALSYAVLENLLGNAWKYTSKKSEAFIKVSGFKQGNEQVFYIQDNGAGFDMTFSDKLFVAFQRLHSPMDYQGTGIGLITVKRIIERHGGKVWAQGEEGVGSTFYFTFSNKRL